MDTYRIIAQEDFTEVTLAQARAQVRMTASQTYDDAYLELLISTCASEASEYLHFFIQETTVEQYMESFEQCVRLYGGNLSEITSITCLDADGETTTLTEDDYSLNVINDTLTISETFDSYTDFVIMYTAGVFPVFPKVIKQAILIMVANYYNMREDVVIGQTATQVPKSAEILLSRVRRYVT